MPGDDATTAAVSAHDLRMFCLDALTRVGVGGEDAQTTADVLVTTDTWGVFTHGVKSLHGYIRRIQGGGIRADARPRVTAEGPGWAIVDGDSALGMVASTFAMRVAIEKARACGIGYAGVFNSCHFGDPSIPTEHGAAFIAVNIAAMMPIDEFKGRVDTLAREIRESPRAEEADSVYLPGEIEWERRKKSLAEGITLPRDVRLSVAELSRELGIAALKSGTIEEPIPNEPRP